MEQNDLNEIVKEYVNKIKEKLPEWLKEDKQELIDILDEIEEHIWDRAEELSSNGTSMESAIEQVLTQMGTPQSIAREYKRRGVPKVYITEDLFPLYTKVLGILSIIVVTVYLVFMIINLFLGRFQLDIIGILFGLTGVFTIVTLIFVALSMEGYLPENLKTQQEQEMEKRRVKLAAKKGVPLSSITEKPFIEPTSNIVGGIIQMAIGLIFVLQPETGLTPLIAPEFLIILRFFGVLIICEGGLHLIRGIIGNQQITKHQIIIGVKIFVSVLNIPLLVILMERPELVPFVPFEDFWISGFFGFVIAMVVIGAISNAYKAITLEKYRVKTNNSGDK
ncbi:MAG: permease prefix domain 1-containing protein [Candidatus Hermodarchaeota archaeon]